MGSLSRFDIEGLKRDYNLSSFVETGTFEGDAVDIASKSSFFPIFSVELIPKYWDLAVRRFSSKEDTINILLGSSIDRLPDIIPNLQGPTLWWLDAHLPSSYGVKSNSIEETFPLETELRFMAASRDLSKDVIIMDDLRIYEQGPFGHGNAPAERAYYQSGAGFIEDILGKTHNCTKIYEDEGYIVCTPRGENTKEEVTKNVKFDPKQKIYVICETGAVGDTIATFPILKILSDKGHIEKLFIDKRYIELYRVVFPLDIIVDLKDAMTIIPRNKVTPDIPKHVINPKTGEACFLSYPLKQNIPVVHSNNKNGLLPLHASLVDGFSAAIANVILRETERDYPFISQDKLPINPLKGKKYVVVSYGATTEHRKMLPEVFIDLKRYFIEKGYEIVLLGKKDHQLAVSDSHLTVTPQFDGIDSVGCIDMIDKTTLLESLSILHDAALMIGVDGGLMHLAGCTDIPIVGGFTTVDPHYRTIYRHNTYGWRFYPVKADSDCKFCQTDTWATYGINFHVCNHPNKTKECMYSLTSSKWIEQIEKALSEG